jgi:phosphoglycerate dehydrogenase-like enzyme
LINMARGGVVNSADLLETLKQKRIAGAALDVFSPEPIPFGHEILSFNNVILTPHIGTATVECRKEMAEYAAKNIITNSKS